MPSVQQPGMRCRKDTHLHLTPAGYWYAFVSIPIFQFILLRWYLRLLIWFRLLWQVSRLNLRLISTHPDRAGGLAFLGKSYLRLRTDPFRPRRLLAGLIASRILYEGESLLSFKVEVVAWWVSSFCSSSARSSCLRHSSPARNKGGDWTNTDCSPTATSKDLRKSGFVGTRHKAMNFWARRHSVAGRSRKQLCNRSRDAHRALRT